MSFTRAFTFQFPQVPSPSSYYLNLTISHIHHCHCLPPKCTKFGEKKLPDRTWFLCDFAHPFLCLASVSPSLQ
jgi:hypothetical protein